MVSGGIELVVADLALDGNGYIVPYPPDLTTLGEKTVTWYEPQTQLRESAITATKRPIGGGWGFGGDNSSPIEAASLALWGAKTSKWDPNRKMLIG